MREHLGRTFIAVRPRRTMVIMNNGTLMPLDASVARALSAALHLFGSL